MFNYKLLSKQCLPWQKISGDSNGVKEEKEAVGATEEASVSEVKTDNGEKLVENEDKVDNDPSKAVSEEQKEPLIAQEEIPAPGLVLTTKRLKSSKVKLMRVQDTGCFVYISYFVH